MVEKAKKEPLTSHVRRSGSGIEEPARSEHEAIEHPLRGGAAVGREGGDSRGRSVVPKDVEEEED